MKNEAIAVTVIVSMLILWVQHWGIASVVRKQFHPLANYCLGTLAIFVPLAILYWRWGRREELLAMGLVIIGAGLAVAFAYALDHYAARIHALIAERRERQEAEEREHAALAGLRQVVGAKHVQE